MKKVKIDAAKLQLHKERVTNLTNEQMNDVNGGGILWSLIGRCGTSSNQPPPQPNPALSCQNNETNACNTSQVN